MLSITRCPICDGKNFEDFLTCTDYTVSHETFTIVKCPTCSLLATSPRPDEHQIEKYYLSNEYISHAVGTSSIFDFIYKFARRFTLRWKINILEKNIQSTACNNPQTLLDVGCGTGEFLAKCKDKGFTIAGVEPSSVARMSATKLTGQEILQTLESTNGQFEVITLWHVLEHVHDLNQYLVSLKSKLSKNGTMFIAVPNHESQDAKTYQQNWAGYDVPRHLWHFNQTSMKSLINNHSFKLIKVIPMKLDAFYVSILSEKQTRKASSPVGIIRGISKGLVSNLSAAKTCEYSSLIYILRK
jgi:SAM-dependent methyltransferase